MLRRANLCVELCDLPRRCSTRTGCTWHDHSGAHLAFRQAILSRLARLKPKEGPTTFGERPHQTGPGDDPQIIGQWVEYSAWETRDWTPEAVERLRAGKAEVPGGKS